MVYEKFQSLNQINSNPFWNKLKKIMQNVMKDLDQDLDDEGHHQTSMIGLQVKFKTFIRKNNRTKQFDPETQIQRQLSPLILTYHLNLADDPSELNDTKSKIQLNNTKTNSPYKVWADKYIQSCINSQDQNSFKFVQNQNHPKVGAKRNVDSPLYCDNKNKKYSKYWVDKVQTSTQKLK